MRVSVIIAAAGSGSRMQHSEKKQFIEIDGIPIVVRTLQVFKRFKEISEWVLVTSEEDIEKTNKLLRDHNILDVKVVSGGSRRQDSIYNALKVVTGDVVMIHDGARPFVTHEILTANLTALETCDGVITCVPCKDTIKVVEEGYVAETLDREKLVQVQTPQTFRVSLILKAYEVAALKNVSVTDDATLLEHMGYRVKVVMGSYDNIKITTPEDLVVGEQILRGL